MRILQACPYSWDSPGGVQAHVRRLTRHLERRGHEVLVVAPGRDRPAQDGVHIVGRPMRIRYNGSVAPICSSLRSAARIVEILDRFAPDIVHVHEPFTPSTSMYAALCADAPVVATFHANVARSKLLAAARPLLRFLSPRHIDCASAVSQAAAMFPNREVGIPTAVVPNGLDVDTFQEAKPSPLPAGRQLLFVGRLEPRKGVPVILRAFATIAQRLPDLLLVVIGDGQDRAAIDQLPSYIRERIVMLGALPDNDLPGYYAAADVFVGPATGGESFGTVLLEAMAAGLPIVASDISGYREVVRHEVEGLLVPPGDALGFADAVERILSNRALAVRLASNGRARARQFSWETLVERVEEMYRAAADGHRRSAFFPVGRRAISSVLSLVRAGN